MPDLDVLLTRRFVFCGGKGGVGKTSIAAALGVCAARRGLRVRVISTDPAHSLGDVFEHALGHRPMQIGPGLEAMELDPDAAVEAYLDEVAGRLRDYVKPALYAEVDRQIAQARGSPGAAEAALLEALAQLLTEDDDGVDLTIFDTAPTGHTLRLVSLPETMAAWTDGLLGQRRESEALGRAFRGIFQGGEQTEGDRRKARLATALEHRRRLFADARAVLTDAVRTAFVLVLIPERLPLEETSRAVDALAASGIEVTGLIVNQVLPEIDDGAFFGARRKVQQCWLERIEARLADLPRIKLPLLAGEVSRSAGLEELADCLERS